MTVAVVALWSDSGCEWRQRAWAWLQPRLHDLGAVVEGDGATPGGYSRTRAILDGAAKTDADVLVITDADVWVDDLAETIERAVQHGWAVPHRLIHRLSPESTEKVLAGADWRGLPLSTDNHQDSRPYTGHEAGTLLAVRRDVLELAPPDPRFVGWGSEDDAWAYALRCLVGTPWRGRADLVHLWHPAQPRDSREIGNQANDRLLRRYIDAHQDAAAMSALLAEARLSEDA